MTGLNIVDGRVRAYDIVDMDNEHYDRIITDEEWEKSGCKAYVRNNTIILNTKEEMTDAEYADIVRAERCFRLNKCDRISPLYWETLSEEDKNKCRQYRQELLDITKKQGFPWNGDIKRIPWPDVPRPIAALSYRYDLLPSDRFNPKIR